MSDIKKLMASPHHKLLDACVEYRVKIDLLELENAALREMLRVCANNANDSGEDDSMEDQINELIGNESQP